MKTSLLRLFSKHRPSSDHNPALLDILHTYLPWLSQGRNSRPWFTNCHMLRFLHFKLYSLGQCWLAFPSKWLWKGEKKHYHNRIVFLTQYRQFSCPGFGLVRVKHKGQKGAQQSQETQVLAVNVTGAQWGSQRYSPHGYVLHTPCIMDCTHSFTERLVTIIQN